MNAHDDILSVRNYVIHLLWSKSVINVLSLSLNGSIQSNKLLYIGIAIKSGQYNKVFQYHVPLAQLHRAIKTNTVVRSDKQLMVISG